MPDISKRPSAKRLIRLLIPEFAGEQVVAYCCPLPGSQRGGLYVPEYELMLANKSDGSYRAGVVKDTVKPGDEYEDLFGSFDGRGDLLTIGARVYYAKENQVRTGTVEGFGNRSSCDYLKTKIREDLDVRDYDWHKNGGLFILNTPFDCLIIPE